MGRIHNPPHPGESMREDILPALGLSVTEAAKQLGVTRVTLSRLIHGQSGISARMARRLEAWLGGPKCGPSAESWLRMQVDYDLWQAMQQPAPKVPIGVRPFCFPGQGSSLFVAARLRQLSKREFREQCMHLFRRVQRIPKEVSIAVVAERALGDAKCHA